MGFPYKLVTDSTHTQHNKKKKKNQTNKQTKEKWFQNGHFAEG